MATVATRLASLPSRSALRYSQLPSLYLHSSYNGTRPVRRLLDRRLLSSEATHPASGPPTFSFSIAASYIAKDRPFDPATHVFHFHPHNRIQQTRNKRLRPDSGQDAFFVSRVGDTGGVALGVADGVGGWMDSGVDPADFSHSFCNYMADAAYNHRPAPSDTSLEEAPRKKDRLTAKQLMQTGYEAVCHDSAIKAGGSTAVVAVLAPDGTVEVANLGDSGVIHLRLNAVHGCSEAQTHAFNTPYQLSVIPPSTLARMAAFGGTQLSDLPRDAEVTRHALRHGDVLVFASDGLWDNLYNQDVLRIVSGAMTTTGAWRSTDKGIRAAPDLTSLTDSAPGPEPTLQAYIATEITAAAKAASVNTKANGPFAKEVKKYFPHDPWTGGKVDDITVVVVIISEDGKAIPIASKL